LFSINRQVRKKKKTRIGYIFLKQKLEPASEKEGKSCVVTHSFKESRS
jgi:hypothetical protein